MAFDPGQEAHNVGGFAKAHPMATAAIVVGVVVLVWYLMSGSGSSASTAPAQGSSSDANTLAAANIVAAQTSANEQTSLAQIAAGVTNNQTAAAKSVALATIKGQTNAAVAASAATTASAYYGAETAISNNNSAVAVAGLQAQSTEQVSGDTLLASEFSNLADVLKSFGLNAQNITASGNTSQVSIGAQTAQEYGDYVTAATTPISETETSTAAAGGQLLGQISHSITTLPNVAAPGGGAGGVGSGTVQTQTMWGLQTLQSYFSQALGGLSGLFGQSAVSAAPATNGTGLASAATSVNATIASNLVVPSTSTQAHP